MRKEIKVQVEQISNGYLFTEQTEDNKNKKSFKESKNYVVEMLTESEEFQNILNNESDIMVEIVCYDIETDVTIPNINATYNGVVEQHKFDPFKNKPIDEEALRLSVTKENAYSTARLQEIDFKDLDRQLSMTHIRKAEICGLNKATFYSNWAKVLKGSPSFGSPSARIAFTILAKFYELSLGIRTSKKDEIEKIREGVNLEINNLTELFKRNNHIHTNSLEPIIIALKNLIK